MAFLRLFLVIAPCIPKQRSLKVLIFNVTAVTRSFNKHLSHILIIIVVVMSCLTKSDAVGANIAWR